MSKPSNESIHVPRRRLPAADTEAGTRVDDVVRAIMYAESYGSYEAGIETFRRSAGASRCGRRRSEHSHRLSSMPV